MATITSLKFDIASKWDGSAVKQAQGDIKMLNQELRATNNARIRVRVDLDDTKFHEDMRRLDNATRNKATEIKLDVDTAHAEAQIARVARDRTIDLRVDSHGLGDEMVRITNHFGNASNSASNFGNQASSSGRMAHLAMMAFAASLIALPGLINLVSSALLVGLAGSVVAVGAIILRNNEEIRAGWEHLKNDGIQIFKEAAAPMKDEFVGALDAIHDRMWQLKGTFNDVFANAAPLIRPMTDSILDLVTNALPGMNDALRNSRPVIDGLHQGMANFGTSISNMFRNIGSKAEAFGMMLNLTFTHIGIMMDNFSVASMQMADSGTRSWGALLTSFNSLIKGMLDGFVGFTNNAGEPFAKFVEFLGFQLGDVFRKLMPLLGDIVRIFSEKMLPALERLVPVAITFLEEGIKGLLPAMDGLMPIVAAIADGFATILEWLTPASPVILGVAAAFWAVNAALAMNPIVAITIAVIALVSGIVYLATKTQFFQTIWENTWNFVKSVSSAVWGWITATWNDTVSEVTGAWDAVKGFFSASWEVIKTTAMSIWNNMKQAWHDFVSMLQIVWDTVTAPFRAAFDAWWFAVRMTVAVVVTAIRVAWEGLTAALRAAWDIFSAPFQAAWDFLWNGTKAAASGIWDWVQAKWDQFLNTVRAIWDAVSGALSAAWNAVWSAIRDAAAAIWDWIQAKWDQILNQIKAILQAQADFIRQIWDACWAWVRDKAAQIWDSIQAKWDAFTGFIRTILQNVVDWITDKWGAIWNWVSDKATAVWDFISTKFTEFKDGVIKTVEGIVERVGEVWNGVVEKFSAPVRRVKEIWNDIAGPLKLPTFNLAEGGAVGDQPPAISRAQGGPVWGAGTTTSDSVPARLSRDEHVWTAREVAAAGGHKKVEALRQEALAGGLAGGGAVEWMWARVQEMNQGMQLTSSYRNTSDYHGQGKAIDVSNGSDDTPQMQSVANSIANQWGGQTLELIHSPFGNNIKNGRSVGDGFGFYGAGTMGEHRNHVHWAVDGPLDGRAGGPIGGGQFVDPKMLKMIDDTIAKINKERELQLMEHRERQRFVNQVQASRAASGKDLFAGLGSDIPWNGFDPNSAEMVKQLEAKKAAMMAAASSADLGPITANAIEHAREIANAAKERNLGKRGAKIGTATALVESNLRMLANNAVPESLNFPHEGLGSDHDSIGLFQQRSAGWGTVAQRMNARASAGMFFNALQGFDWQSMEDGAAAQRVQRSAYPGRYSERMGQAQGIVDQVYAKGTMSAQKGFALTGENGPEIVRFNGGEEVHSFDEIIAAIKNEAIGNTNQIIDRFTQDINAAIDRLGGVHEQALTSLTNALSAEVKSFVAQAIEGQAVNTQELTSKLELQLRNFVEGALQQHGLSMDMKVELPNGTSATPQQIADAFRSQVFPELQRFIEQRVGTRN